MTSDIDLRGSGSDRMVRAQNRLLEEVVRAAPLGEILDSLIRMLEEQSVDGVLGSVLLYDEATQTLRHGAAPSLPLAYNQEIDGVAIGPTVGSCGTAAFRRETVIVSDIQTDPLWDDFRALAEEHGLRSCWSTPILAGGVLLGTFAMYYRKPLMPTEDDLAVAKIFARTASLAIGRHRADTDREELLREQARLLEAEKCARETLEVTARRLEILATTASELAKADTTSAVGDAVVGPIAHALGANSAALCCLDAAGTSLTLEASIGVDPESMLAFSSFDLNSDLPASEAVRTGKPVILRTVADRDERFPTLAGKPVSHIVRAVVPLMLDGRATGALALGWKDAETATTEPELLRSVAQQCAQALGRTRLVDAERTARERIEFLAQASDVLSRSLDYRETLALLVRTLVPFFADEASVHVLQGPDLELVGTAHVDPQLEAVMLEMAAREQGRTGEQRMLAVASTGTSLFVPEVDGSRPSFADPVVQAGFERLAPRSAIIVPLIARGDVIGIMTTVMSVSGRRFTEADLALLEDVARRAGVSLAHARSHASVTEIARTLQQSLLPASLPALPALDLAATHHTAGDGTDPGGDVYDVWNLRPASDGTARIGALIADVSGKGVRAAALTALVRYTVRAASLVAQQPSDVLHRVNEAILTTGPTLLDNSSGFVEGRFATMVMMEIATCDGYAEVRMCVGGHPPVLLRRADGSVSPVGEPGTAVGLIDNPVFRDSTIRLLPGDALIAYTDGYTEARSPESEFSGDYLERLVAETTATTAEGLATELESRLLAFQGGRARDDMALLVIRYAPAHPA